jgi:hypothetical protein
MPFPIRHHEILIVSESQNSLTRSTVRISHSAISGYSEHWKKLEGCTFANPIEVMTEINTILSKIPLEIFILIFDEWKCTVRECIEKEGEYL